MLPIAATWTAGAVLLYHLPVLPSPGWLLLAPAALLPVFGRPGFVFKPLAAVLLGFLWALLHANYAACPEVFGEREGQDLLVEGVVASLPENTRKSLRFNFDIEHIITGKTSIELSCLVRLSWYRDFRQVVPGDRWRLLIRVKRPHGFANPGGFDFERWLYRNGICGTGYVRTGLDNALVRDSGDYRLNRWRYVLRQDLREIVTGLRYGELVPALVIGDRSGISPDLWNRFARTGTSHLMAISGLHIGIISGLVFLLARRFWPCLGKAALFVPASRAAAVMALATGAGYAALAGFSVPTLRAVLMLGVVLGGQFLRRAPRRSDTLGAALLLVVAIDPRSVLGAGFWLSFLAVAVILFGLVGRVAGGKAAWTGWGRVQWVVSLGLAPLLVILQMPVSVLAPLVNLAAVPLFSMLVIPLVLIGTAMLCLYPPLARSLFLLSDTLLTAGLGALEWLAGLPLAALAVAERPPWTWWLGFVAVALALAPARLPGRPLAGVLVLPLLASGGSEPARGELWVSVLDVGQGLAVVVRTSGHALVYDTGARFSDRFDAGSAVLLPYLRSVGLKHVDLLVVTHSDNDHSGGAQAVLEGIPVRKFVSGEPPDSTGRSATRCQSGDAWHWDGVEFRFLHPQSPGVHDGNNASCVLHIRHPRGTVLLTGDIEAGVERELLQRDPDLLDVDLVTVPHHGSRTSSIEGFVDALSPDYAVVAAGYRNRYGFPKPDVVERWRRRGATVLNTSDTGAIRFRLGPGGLEPVESYRSQKRRFWRTVTSHESRGRAPFKESDH